MSTLTIVLLVILIILIVGLVVLYFMGNKAQKNQAQSQEMLEAAKQPATILVIDKKRLKITESGLPKQVIDQVPWYSRRMKLPIVKAKIGPRVMTMIADGNVFEQLPLKKECNVIISGLYITDVKSVRGGSLLPVKKPTGWRAWLAEKAAGAANRAQANSRKK